ncbi:hypothetical protein Tco_1147512 [Tanacetum coccineum]
MADPASPDHAPASPDHIHGSPGQVRASPDHVFAFPDDTPASYIKEDQDMDIDEVDPEEDQEMDFKDEDDKDWLMALVTPSTATLLVRQATPPSPLSTPAPLLIDPVSTFEIRGPSSAAPDAPHPVGSSYFFGVLILFSVNPVSECISVFPLFSRLEALHVRLDRVESIQTRAKSIEREIEKDVRWLEERHGDGDHMQDVLDVVQTKVAKLRYRVDNYPRDQVDTLRFDVDGLHKGA